MATKRQIGSIVTLSIPMSGIITEKEIVVEDINELVPVRWEGTANLISVDVKAIFSDLGRINKKAHTKVIWAKNGKEAVEPVKGTPDIDMVLIDIKIPRLSG